MLNFITGYAMKNKIEPQKYYDWKTDEGTRRLTTIKTQDCIYPFYRSTGRNSSSPNTWFPMQSMDEDFYINKPDTYTDTIKSIKELLNPRSKELVSDFSAMYPLQVVNYWFSLDNKSPITDKTSIKEIEKTHNEGTYTFALLRRFGSVECMCISYCLGGGFWDKRAALPVKDMLETLYPQELKRLKNTIPGTDLWEKQEITHADNSKINRFLIKDRSQETKNITIINRPGQSPFYVDYNKFSYDEKQLNDADTMMKLQKDADNYGLSFNRLIDMMADSDVLMYTLLGVGSALLLGGLSLATAGLAVPAFGAILAVPIVAGALAALGTGVSLTWAGLTTTVTTIDFKQKFKEICGLEDDKSQKSVSEKADDNNFKI